jgi:hypothetical protein
MIPYSNVGARYGAGQLELLRGWCADFGHGAVQAAEKGSVAHG